MRQFLVPALTLLAFAVPVAAHADTFDFTFTTLSGPSITATGVFTTSATETNGFYTVTALSGTQNGAAMTLLVPGSYASNDNDLSPIAPYVDVSGITYDVDGIGYNLYANGIVDTLCNSVSSPNCYTGDGVPVALTVTAAATPEPSSLALLGTGILAAAGAARRKFRKA